MSTPQEWMCNYVSLINWIALHHAVQGVEKQLDIWRVFQLMSPRFTEDKVHVWAGDSFSQSFSLQWIDLFVLKAMYQSNRAR